MQFKSYLEHIKLITTSTENDLLEEGLNRNIIVKKSGYKGADYEWEANGLMFYLHAAFVDGDPTKIQFKFVDEFTNIKKTDRLNKSATSVFSGAIIAIKKYLDEHQEVDGFLIVADNDEPNRNSLYARATSQVAKFTGFEYTGHDLEDNKTLYFFEKDHLRTQKT